LAAWNTSRTASGLHRSMSATVNTTGQARLTELSAVGCNAELPTQPD
jgi:hypothetical protein